jgi:hypothetical protein
MRTPPAPICSQETSRQLGVDLPQCPTLSGVAPGWTSYGGPSATPCQGRGFRHSPLRPTGCRAHRPGDLAQIPAGHTKGDPEREGSGGRGWPWSLLQTAGGEEKGGPPLPLLFPSPSSSPPPPPQGASRNLQWRYPKVGTWQGGPHCMAVVIFACDVAGNEHLPPPPPRVHVGAPIPARL